MIQALSEFHTKPNSDQLSFTKQRFRDPAIPSPLASISWLLSVLSSFHHHVNKHFIISIYKPTMTIPEVVAENDLESMVPKPVSQSPSFPCPIVSPLQSPHIQIPLHLIPFHTPIHYPNYLPFPCLSSLIHWPLLTLRHGEWQYQTTSNPLPPQPPSSPAASRAPSQEPLSHPSNA